MYNESFLMLAIFSALLVYMIDYGFGQPGNEKWNSQDLLSWYPYEIAKLTLMKHDAWDNLKKQLDANLSNATTELERLAIKKSFREIVFSTARDHFTGQKAMGMCPICFHFWVSFFLFITVNKFYLKENIIIFTLYFLLSHFIIRVLKKYF